MYVPLLEQVNPDTIEMTPTLYPIEPMSQKPYGFTETDAPLFYGRIVLGEGMKSIKGMSEGPIFAFHQNEKGELRYWLTALQSRWLPESHFIAAFPTKLLGHFLEDIVTRAKQESRKGGSPDHEKGSPLDKGLFRLIGRGGTLMKC